MQQIDFKDMPIMRDIIIGGYYEHALPKNYQMDADEREVWEEISKKENDLADLLADLPEFTAINNDGTHWFLRRFGDKRKLWSAYQDESGEFVESNSRFDYDLSVFALDQSELEYFLDGLRNTIDNFDKLKASHCVNIKDADIEFFEYDLPSGDAPGMNG